MATMEELLSGTHEHDVLDADSRFLVDAATRSISPGYPSKTLLIQGDHNSERFGFEIPRWIEEHDMSLCDKVEVHYININTEASARDEKSITGLYEVRDMRVDPDDENLVVCSWLIDYHATQLVGPLNFLLCFKCEKDGVISYAWHTAPYVGVSIVSGINADETFEDDYCDVIEQWKESVLNGLEVEMRTAVDEMKGEVSAWQQGATDNVQTAVNEVRGEVSAWERDAAENVRSEMTEFCKDWNATLDVERVRIDELAAMRTTGGAGKYTFEDDMHDATAVLTTNGAVAKLLLDVRGVMLANGDRWAFRAIPQAFAPMETVQVGEHTFGDNIVVNIDSNPYEGAVLITFLNRGEGTTLSGDCELEYPLACLSIPEVTDARVGLDEQGEEKAYATVEDNILAAHNKAKAAHEMAAGAADLANGHDADIATLYNEIAAIKQNGTGGSVARISYVDLPASGWQGTESPYSQVVSVDGATENSQVDLTPSVEQLSVFYNKDLAFVTENEDGVVTVYAIGQKPANDYRIQVTITEVVR